jgi:hypothetical protein
MTFDKPEHKELCRQMIQSTTFSGQVLDLVYEFKQAVENAECKTIDAPVTSTEVG